MLTKLTDLILFEELSDTDPDKMLTNECPILSERQKEARLTGRRNNRRKDGIVRTAVPLEHGQFAPTCGEDYSPHRRAFNNSF